jgi:hypothetical protein
MSNKVPVITLYYDSQAHHPIYSVTLKDETTCFGSDQPSPILYDKTVEPVHVSVIIKHNTIYIQNKSTQQGTYTIIPPHTAIPLQYHQYIVIGVTWISFTKENGRVVMAFIRPDFTVINCCRVDYGRTLILGRSEKCDIALDDNCVSKMHLKVTINEKEIVCEDLGSANHVFISIDELSFDKSESSPLLRLGEKTFLKYEYKEAPVAKAKMECFFPEDPTKYMLSRAIRAIS